MNSFSFSTLMFRDDALKLVVVATTGIVVVVAIAVAIAGVVVDDAFVVDVGDGCEPLLVVFEAKLLTS